jgi:hypothetical protein
MNLKKITFFFFFPIIINSCSSNIENKSVFLKYPDNIARLDGKHAVFIPKNSFQILQNVGSDDCESWNLKINFDKLFNESYRGLINKMTSDLVFVDTKLTKKDLEQDNFSSFIYFKDSKVILDFRTIRNTGKLKITLISEIDLEGANKKINNTLKSEQSWEKNIYLNCNVVDGAIKISERAFESLLKQVHENIYKSIQSIIR